MKIGIDARPLSKRITGIGIYLNEIVKYLNIVSKDNEHEYILYSNSKIILGFKLNENWKIKIIKFPVGTIWLNTVMEYCLLKDRLDLFWGTAHILPFLKFNVKMVLTVHDLSVLKFDVGTKYNYYIQKIFIKSSCYNADRIIAVSNSTKNDFISDLGVKPSKISVIYPGANDKLIPINVIMARKILKSRYGIQGKFILYLGTIEPRKNISTIIKAFKIAKHNKKFNCKLVIVGGLGWRYDDVFKTVERLNLKNDVIFTGYIDTSDKIYFYNSCEFFVFPSIYEGFGTPILEAMKCGKAVIATNSSSMPEVVGQAGLLIDDCYDYKDLSSKIKKIYFDTDLNKKLTEIALKRSRKFSYLNCAISIARIFNETFQNKENQ